MDPPCDAHPNHTHILQSTHKPELLPRERDSTGLGGAQAQGRSASDVTGNRQESEENAKQLSHQRS